MDEREPEVEADQRHLLHRAWQRRVKRIEKDAQQHDADTYVHHLPHNRHPHPPAVK
ncbi:MAG: hypothetical protein ACR2GU_01515 [Rubrobacteraceae bacterium]